MKKIDLGVSSLNKQLSGGMPKGFIVLCKGKVGTGKTLLLREFMLQGMKEKDNNIYIIPNKNPLHAIEVMKLYNLSLDLSRINFFVFEGIITKKTEFIQGNYFSLMDLLIELNQFIDKLDGKNIRLVFENLSSVFIGVKEERVFEFLKQLFLTLRKKQVTALIEVQPDALDERVLAKLESITDGSIQFKKEQNRRYLLIERMSELPISFKWLPFEASKGKGIKVIEFYK